MDLDITTVRAVITDADPLIASSLLSDRGEQTLHIEDAARPGMMLVFLRIEEGAVTVTEFDGWEIAAETRFTGTHDRVAGNAGRHFASVARAA